MRKRLRLVLFSALLHVTFSLHEFVFVSDSMNWPNAQKYCRQHYTDLATIDDQEDHDQLLKTVGMGNVWIGLSRTTYPGDFVWSDQSRSSFRRWKSGTSNQLCVKVYDGFWYDSRCVASNPFVCYIGRKRQIVRLGVKSSQDLNDPKVMNQTLFKMEQILKEKGLAQDAKLAWGTQSDGNVFQKERKRDATEQMCISQFYRK